MISKGTPTDHFIENPSNFMHHRVGEKWLNKLQKSNYREWRRWWEYWERGKDIPVNPEFTEGLSWHPEPVILRTKSESSSSHRKVRQYGGNWKTVHRHRVAEATHEFMEEWRRDKETMKNSGYRLYKDSDSGIWMMAYYKHLAM